MTSLRTPFHFRISNALAGLVTAPWPPKLRRFAFDLASGGLATGKGIKDVTTSRCLLCGAAQDSVGHYLAECAYLQPLRSWLGTIWHSLQWSSPSPGASPRHFALFIAYGWAPRVGSRDACVALHGAALQACRTARARLIKTGSPMANHDMIHQAKRRLASHIALDWRCATNPDPFAADVHSVRPNSRRAFFKRWGCLCRVNAGNYTLEECADPDR